MRKCWLYKEDCAACRQSGTSKMAGLRCSRDVNSATCVPGRLCPSQNTREWLSHRPNEHIFMLHYNSTLFLSPEPTKVRDQSQFIYLFIYLFIHAFIHSFINFMNIRWSVHHSNSGISSPKQRSVLPSNTFAHVHKFLTLPRDANTSWNCTKILCSCNLTYRVWSTSERHTEIKLLPHREHRRLNYKDWPFNIIQSLITVRVTRNTYIGLQCVCVCVCVCVCTAQWLLNVLSGSVLNTPHYVPQDYVPVSVQHYYHNIKR